MATHAAQINLPEELIEEIDSLVGSGSLEAFLVETAQAEVRRRQLSKTLETLRLDGPIWKDEDHPELVALGTEGWVRALRQESDERLCRVPADEDTRV